MINSSENELGARIFDIDIEFGTIIIVVKMNLVRGISVVRMILVQGLVTVMMNLVRRLLMVRMHLVQRLLTVRINIRQEGPIRRMELGEGRLKINMGKGIFRAERITGGDIFIVILNKVRGMLDI